MILTVEFTVSRLARITNGRFGTGGRATRASLGEDLTAITDARMSAIFIGNRFTVGMRIFVLTHTAMQASVVVSRLAGNPYLPILMMVGRYLAIGRIADGTDGRRRTVCLSAGTWQSRGRTTGASADMHTFSIGLPIGIVVQFCHTFAAMHAYIVVFFSVRDRGRG